MAVIKLPRHLRRCSDIINPSGTIWAGPRYKLVTSYQAQSDLTLRGEASDELASHTRPGGDRDWDRLPGTPSPQATKLKSVRLPRNTLYLFQFVS
jgi:hypothetical protein